MPDVNRTYPKETYGVIPKPERVKTFVNYYDRVITRIKNTVMQITVLNYTDTRANMAISAMKNTIHILNLKSYKFLADSIRLAYNQARITTTRTLKRDFGYEEPVKKVNHQKAIIELTKDGMKYLIRANKSIMKSIQQYLTVIKKGSVLINTASKIQLQEFRSIPDAQLSDDMLLELENIVQDAREYKTVYTKSGFPYKAAKTGRQLEKEWLDDFYHRFGDANFIEINGRHYQLKWYAETLIRTEMREAQTQAIKNSCEEYGHDLVRWSEHFGSCKVCQPFEGNIYSLSGKHPVYEELSGEPPLHPRCEHNINPVGDPSEGLIE